MDFPQIEFEKTYHGLYSRGYRLNIELSIELQPLIAFYYWRKWVEFEQTAWNFWDIITPNYQADQQKRYEWQKECLWNKWLEKNHPEELNTISIADDDPIPF